MKAFGQNIVSSYLTPLGQSVGVHVVILIFLIVSIDFSLPEQEEKPLAAPVIEAVTIDQAALEQQIKQLKSAQLREKSAEEKRIKRLEERAKKAKADEKKLKEKLKKLEQDKKRKQEEKKKAEVAAKKAKEKQRQEKEKAKKAEQARLKKEKERKKAEEAAKKAKKKAEEAAKKRKLEEEKARKAKAERERKAKEEKERKAKEARERKARQEQEKLLQEQLAAEQAARRSARRKVVLTEAEKYKALIQAKFEQYFISDESTMRNKTCRVNISIAFNGLVTRVRSMGGDKIVCDAAERAAYKAGSMPVPKDRDVYEEIKDVTFVVQPEF